MFAFSVPCPHFVLSCRWARDFVTYTGASAETPKVLIFDNLDAHIDIDTLEFLETSGVSVVGLPGHTSHHLQVLDTHVFKRVKKRFYSLVSEREKRGGAVERRDVAGMVATVMKDAQHTVNAQNGFEDNGIWPLNRYAFADSKFEVAERMTLYFSGRSNDRPPPGTGLVAGDSEDDMEEESDSSDLSSTDGSICGDEDGCDAGATGAPHVGAGAEAADVATADDAAFDWGAVRAVRWHSRDSSVGRTVNIKQEDEREDEGDDESEDDDADPTAHGTAVPRTPPRRHGSAQPVHVPETVETPEALRQRVHAGKHSKGLVNPQRRVHSEVYTSPEYLQARREKRAQKAAAAAEKARAAEARGATRANRVTEKLQSTAATAAANYSRAVSRMTKATDAHASGSRVVALAAAKLNEALAAQQVAAAAANNCPGAVPAKQLAARTRAAKADLVAEKATASHRAALSALEAKQQAVADARTGAETARVAAVAATVRADGDISQLIGGGASAAASGSGFGNGGSTAVAPMTAVVSAGGAGAAATVSSTAAQPPATTSVVGGTRTPVAGRGNPPSGDKRRQATTVAAGVGDCSAGVSSEGVGADTGGVGSGVVADACGRAASAPDASASAVGAAANPLSSSTATAEAAVVDVLPAGGDVQSRRKRGRRAVPAGAVDGGRSCGVAVAPCSGTVAGGATGGTSTVAAEVTGFPAADGGSASAVVGGAGRVVAAQTADPGGRAGGPSLRKRKTRTGDPQFQWG
eukprot:GHVU01090548.1.p1 GENE.GHVU01090548.1~~GHVU01090548.1.p1  ORF type:complete len:752 (-),score=103.37 GHVU01090548.1:359-2614(-)